MTSIRFVIRNTESENEQTVYVCSRFGKNEKLMYATPLKVEPIFWNEKEQRVKNSKYCPYRDDVNAALNSIEATVKSFIARSAASDRVVVSRESLKNLLDVHFGRSTDRRKDFHSFFEWFIEQCDTRLSPMRGGQTINYKTKREYARTYHYLTEYEKSRKVRLEFRDIDKVFLNDFVAFLQGLGLSTNTICHKTICVKAVMRAANEQELTDNTRFATFRNVSEESQSVALTEKELGLLAEHDFSASPRLERTRDLFLIGCWTGLRFSDFTRIRPENIRGGFLTIQQQKTNEFVTIPLHPVFLSVWEKYGGNLPASISNQKFNDYLKEVCREAGLNERVLKSITKGGKKTTTVYEKWQLVSSHTARRSFATNLYRSGFPSLSIMRITGHKTESSFLKYIKLSRAEHAEMLMEHWSHKGTGQTGTTDENR